MTALYIHQLEVVASHRTVLSIEGLYAEAGEVLGVCGGAGAGKTVLCRVLTETPNDSMRIVSGRILCGRSDLVRAPDHITTAIMSIAKLDRDSLEAAEKAAVRLVVVDSMSAHQNSGAAVPLSGLQTWAQATGIAAIVVDRRPELFETTCAATAVLCGGRLVEQFRRETAADPFVHPYRAALRTGDSAPTPQIAVGCPFGSRCQNATDACTTTALSVQHIDLDHTTTCHRWREIDMPTATRTAAA